MRSFIAISVVAVALTSGAAIAGGNDKQGGSTAKFEALDRDSDQRLSQSEATADTSVAGRFASLDANGDGYVSKREYTARAQTEDQSDDSSGKTDRSQPRPMPERPREPY